VLEAVPNVSEGRDAPAIADIGRAFASRAALLDVHSDADHHRSVFTLAAEPAALVDGLVEGAATAVARIDLRVHDGVHPRVGAVDVVPVVPLLADELETAKRVAVELARRLGDELGFPVLLYGAVGGGKPPAFFRRGGTQELGRRLAAGELVPDFGPASLDPRTGAALVGARAPLVAYNLDLGTDDVQVARWIAAAVRESGGGLPGVQAIGLYLPRAGRVQVSMNVLDLGRSPLHVVVERVRREAAARGVEVVDGELVGLVPEQVVRAADAAGVFVPGLDESRVLERLLAASL
jgi:glutamate formiminotransferase / 5-formyltetrahydrofolate cyclo-ligase